MEPKYNILVYGIEKKGLSPPDNEITSRNYTIKFEQFNTHSRFSDFDGVILFKGIFEKVKWKTGGFEDYLQHTCDEDELDKRKKEAVLLLEQGGFISFLLDDIFIDQEDRRNFEGTDLTKFHLNYSRFYRKNFNGRFTNLNIKSDEFRPFLKIYGAANSHFNILNNHIDVRVLVEAAGKCVGMILHRNNYFIPTLVPDNRAEIIEEYFTLLCEGLTSSFNKLQVLLPDWIREFNFEEESGLKEETDAITYRLGEIQDRTEVLDQFKSVLALAGDDLVEKVKYVFFEGFGLPVDGKDEFREDFKLLNSKSEPFCLCEVKGTNRGVKREYINQADSHRERSGFDQNFPSLLVINTHIKNARSIKEKDQSVANEQIKHAVNMKVLILRTIDLLGLLRIYQNEKLGKGDIEQLLVGSGGWLRVDDEEYELIDLQ